MARHKGRDWDLHDKVSWEDVKVAVLMDLRDALKETNAHLQVLSLRLRCPETLAIPSTLRAIAVSLNVIEKNTKKPRRKVKKSRG